MKGKKLANVNLVVSISVSSEDIFSFFWYVSLTNVLILNLEFEPTYPAFSIVSITFLFQ